MPRNPNKKPCLKPNCRNYAMRGRGLCRSHLDPILGRRGAGAPKGNLNAFKTGAHSRPLSRSNLITLAYQIVDDPDNYHHLIAEAVHLTGRTNVDPIKSILSLQILLKQLLPRVADQLFTNDVEQFLQRYPPAARSEIQMVIWKSLRNKPPLSRLEHFRLSLKSMPVVAKAGKKKSAT